MLHASRNLNIPLAGLNSQNAGGKPDVDAAAETRRAEQPARSDLKTQG